MDPPDPDRCWEHVRTPGSRHVLCPKIENELFHQTSRHSRLAPFAIIIQRNKVKLIIIAF